MNSFERKNLKRANSSKSKWKNKAIHRQIEIRTLQDRCRYLGSKVKKLEEKQEEVEQKTLPLISNLSPSLQVPKTYFF